MKIISKESLLIKKIIRTLLTPKIPKHILKCFRSIDKQQLDRIYLSLLHNCFANKSSSYLSSIAGQMDMQDHLTQRLDNFRNYVIPWLDSVKPLANSKILEIGCGTGSSTVALAEQGAEVTAIDILEASLIVAKARCDAYGLNANFLCINATEIHKFLSLKQFDFIIFFATLEHMTNNERICAMKNSWEMCNTGSFWCLVETPNRLWYYDEHTSQLPFFLWLPDELAFHYSQFSPREDINKMYKDFNSNSILNFQRCGRGISFHEFALTMKKVEELDIVSCMSTFLRNGNPLRKILWKLKSDSWYESFLVKHGPKVHRGFYQPYLDLIIKKN